MSSKGCMHWHYHLIFCITTDMNIQRTLVMKAVRNDSEGKLGLAIDFYIRALEYFIPALECELFSIFQSPQYLSVEVESTLLILLS